MCARPSLTMPRRARGVTLVEVILFIVVIGIAATAILSTFAGMNRRSADPLIQRQAMAIAEALVEEIRLMPFSWCDPDDASFDTATGAFVGANGCAATVEVTGPEAGENRYSAATPFDNVNDYNGFAMPGGGCAAGICDIAGTPIPTLAAYSAAVTVAPVAWSGITLASGHALLISVTVNGPGGISVTLDSIRTRHAPNVG